MTPEDKQLLLQIATMTELDEMNSQLVKSAYKKFINPHAIICTSCPSQIMTARDNLIQHFWNNK